jgi:ribosomal protein S19
VSYNRVFFNEFADELPAVYSRASVISPTMIGERFYIHNGQKPISMLLRDWHLGKRFGDFMLTKSMGKVIHMEKPKGKKKKGKAK